MGENDYVKPSFLGLVPFLVFIIFYVGTGVILEIQGVEMAFYQMPPIIAMLLAIIAAFLLFKDSFVDKLNEFIEGCAQNDIIFISFIFMISGAFSTVCKEIGSVGTVANIGLRYIPPNLLVAGIFLICLFLSTATGSFLGTVVAITPIGFEIADKSGIPLPMVAGAVLGGGAFGDSMSLISDTTIIASRTQGVKIIDLFKSGAFLTFPASILSTIAFAILGSYIGGIGVNVELGDINYLKVVPYLFVLIFAFLGVDVFLVLFFGILIAGSIGIFCGDLTLLLMFKKINEGFLDLSEMLILVIFTGGISYMTIRRGGFEWILTKLKYLAKCRRSAEFTITFLIVVVTGFLSNSGLAILVNGTVTKGMSEANSVCPKRCAALLSISSCALIGALPYGMHMISVMNIAKGTISPLEIMPFLFYQVFLGIIIILSIAFFGLKNQFLSSAETYES
ncbi:Na+/H+ antiporter NhaC family protein [Borrelia miyamotoi]|uniref:Na+/H+ antiporter NhaC family protein n=1 Tax=Borrelia miyamotoi TaxID=47466 RepID=A0AAX3JLE1_9SPIR|nr:Na+/H+ antiporter NhaC family protein [Borrelia miyamotoi]QFP41732.1 Na+/H+ antiporter NhaC family protein [Borrelia miyamotoi]QFP47852.1 Na+/H+ antiporter NhaC family protein [Borrelia miyamotoi]QGT55612.1 Na+/H+ antiporter NhaC family protein [Borrelia miyamotoi]QGT56396.1 Na+/H+ antiporter NhaC family protein [Borrelia miyamotoi]WAZ71641.1 Na+/H+ antiporter NhaC family protein [Borrelia miyamotoi]